MADEENAAYLQITIDRKNPITPEDLAIAILALSSLYDHHPGKLQNSKIVIGNVEEGSIKMLFFIAVTTGTLIFNWGGDKVLDRLAGEQFEQVLDKVFGEQIYKVPDKTCNEMNNFTEYLEKGFERTKEKSAKIKSNREDKRFQKLSKIGSGNDENIVTFEVYDGEKKEKHFHFNGKDANKIIKQAIEEEAKKDKPIKHENQEFRWIASDTTRSRGTDKGLIKRIHLQPQKVNFFHSGTKRVMLEGAIFERKYLVDVLAHYEDSKLKHYEIIELRKIFDENEEEIPRFLSP